MKKWILPALMLLLVISCTQKKLDTQEAYQLLKESKQFPRTLNADIATADPNTVSRLINTDLEKSGFINIREAMSLGDMGSTQILFNEKSNPYLIPASEDEKKRGIQKVRIADEDLASVTEVKVSEDGRKAIAEYTLTFKNVTPFSAISPEDLKSEKRDTANFELKDGKWMLVK